MSKSKQNLFRTRSRQDTLIDLKLKMETLFSELQKGIRYADRKKENILLIFDRTGAGRS
jgi:hypothetical protein